MDKNTLFKKKNHFADAFGNMLNFSPRRDTRSRFELCASLVVFRSRSDSEMLERDISVVGKDMKNAIVRFEHERA